MEFRCDACKLIFQGEGRKFEYLDPIYGPCFKTISACPECGAESTEYRKPKPSKNQVRANDSCPAYKTGSCSCCN